MHCNLSSFHPLTDSCGRTSVPLSKLSNASTNAAIYQRQYTQHIYDTTQLLILFYHW